MIFEDIMKVAADSSLLNFSEDPKVCSISLHLLITLLVLGFLESHGTVIDARHRSGYLCHH